jgi:hypothetical protein
MKKAVLLLLSIYSLCCYSQSDEQYWAKWDLKYPLTDVIKVLKYERNYADSVEKNPKILQYYARTDMYRFKAQYIGQERCLDESLLSSMKTVYKLFIGNPSVLDKLFQSEVLIRIDQDSLWMPIQKELLISLKEEISKGDSLTLYCLFLNEHSSKKQLKNIFLISEFQK